MTMEIHVCLDGSPLGVNLRSCHGGRGNYVDCYNGDIREELVELMLGDFLVAVNSVDVSTFSLEGVYSLIHRCPFPINLVFQRRRGALTHPSVSATASPAKFCFSALLVKYSWVKKLLKYEARRKGVYTSRPETLALWNKYFTASCWLHELMASQEPPLGFTLGHLNRLESCLCIESPTDKQIDLYHRFQRVRETVGAFLHAQTIQDLVENVLLRFQRSDFFNRMSAYYHQVPRFVHIPISVLLSTSVGILTLSAISPRGRLQLMLLQIQHCRLNSPERAALSVELTIVFLESGLYRKLYESDIYFLCSQQPDFAASASESAYCMSFGSLQSCESESSCTKPSTSKVTSQDIMRRLLTWLPRVSAIHFVPRHPLRFFSHNDQSSSFALLEASSISVVEFDILFDIASGSLRLALLPPPTSAHAKRDDIAQSVQNFCSATSPQSMQACLFSLCPHLDACLMERADRTVVSFTSIMLPEISPRSQPSRPVRKQGESDDERIWYGCSAVRLDSASLKAYQGLVSAKSCPDSTSDFSIESDSSCEPNSDPPPPPADMDHSNESNQAHSGKTTSDVGGGAFDPLAQVSSLAQVTYRRWKAQLASGASIQRTTGGERADSILDAGKDTSNHANANDTCVQSAPSIGGDLKYLKGLWWTSSITSKTDERRQEHSMTNLSTDDDVKNVDCASEGHANRTVSSESDSINCDEEVLLAENDAVEAEIIPASAFNGSNHMETCSTDCEATLVATVSQDQPVERWMGRVTCLLSYQPHFRSLRNASIALQQMDQITEQPSPHNQEEAEGQGQANTMTSGHNEVSDLKRLSTTVVKVHRVDSSALSTIEVEKKADSNLSDSEESLHAALLEVIPPAALWLLFHAFLLEVPIVCLLHHQDDVNDEPGATAVDLSLVVILAHWLKESIAPLTWPHILAPQLPPAAALSLLQCPAPFFVGLRRRDYLRYSREQQPNHVEDSAAVQNEVHQLTHEQALVFDFSVAQNGGGGEGFVPTNNYCHWPRNMSLQMKALQKLFDCIHSDTPQTVKASSGIRSTELNRHELEKRLPFYHQYWIPTLYPASSYIFRSARLTHPLTMPETCGCICMRAKKESSVLRETLEVSDNPNAVDILGSSKANHIPSTAMLSSCGVSPQERVDDNNTCKDPLFTWPADVICLNRVSIASVVSYPPTVKEDLKEPASRMSALTALCQLLVAQLLHGWRFCTICIPDSRVETDEDNRQAMHAPSEVERQQDDGQEDVGVLCLQEDVFLTLKDDQIRHHLLHHRPHHQSNRHGFGSCCTLLLSPEYLVFVQHWLRTQGLSLFLIAQHQHEEDNHQKVSDTTS